MNTSLSGPKFKIQNLKPMKILYITPAFQHPMVRGPHRCYHFIKQLSPRHEITLLTLKRSDIPPEALQEVQSYVKEIRMVDTTASANRKKNGKLSAVSQKLKNDSNFRQVLKEMREIFLALVKRNTYDVVLFHGKSIFPVIESWDELPIVIDFCDATAMRFRDRMQFETPGKRFLLKRRYRQFHKIEQKMIEKTPHVAFISFRDRNATVGSENGSKIIPIGVDIEFWTRKTRDPQKNCIVFTGVMNYGPNEDAALYLINNIVSLVKPHVPDLEVLIVGRDPTPVLRATAKKHPGVMVTGFVDDVRTYLELASVFVAPIRYGSGIQNKVLEAFAMEMPVLCTPVVAEGLYMDDRQELPVWVAEDAENFAEALVKLLADDGERARLAREGFRYVEKNFVWSHSAELLENMCIEAVGEKSKV
jgi:glycosyltransferase involved in cell wall biosynthesis